MGKEVETKKPNFISVKIHKKHYKIVFDNKKKHGTPISFYIGNAIDEFEKEKKHQSK